MADEIVPLAGSPPAVTSKTPFFDALEPRQKRFVEEYMIDLNGTQAVLRSGTYEAANENVAGVTAHRLLRNAKIVEAVAELTRERTGLTRAWVLDEIAKDAQTGLGHFATWDSAGNLSMKASEDLTDDQRLRINIKRTWGKSPSLEVKLVDRQAALFKLAEVFGLTKPVDPNAKAGDTNININQAVFTRTPVASREEWEERMKRLARERAAEDAKLIEGTKRK